MSPVCVPAPEADQQPTSMKFGRASTIESAIDAEIAYGVSGGSGGPWTMTSDGKAPFKWTGYENAGSPLRKALGIEIETDQEGRLD